MGLSTLRELMFDATAFGGITVFTAAAIFAAFFDVSLAVRMAFAIALSYAIVFTIRLIHFRARPDHSLVTHWYDRVTQSSFPSLHATRVTALAGIVGQFFMRPGLWVFLVVIVLVTAATRVLLKRHYVSDVIVGCIIGALIALAVGA